MPEAQDDVRKGEISSSHPLFSISSHPRLDLLSSPPSLPPPPLPFRSLSRQHDRRANDDDDHDDHNHNNTGPSGLELYLRR